jgi:hypothetical protein
MEKLFYEMKSVSPIAEELLAIAKAAPESEWQSIRDQNLIFVDPAIVRKDPVLGELVDKYQPGKRIMIFRSFPHAAYSWHRDLARVGCVNMLLQGPNSITLMGEPGTLNAHHIVNIHQVPYKPYRYYLMHVGQLHAVFNYGDDMRYLFSLSLGITDNPDVRYTFPAILDHIKERNF